MTGKRLVELTRIAERGVKMNSPNGYHMLELIDELNHIRGIVFECRRSVERIYDTAKGALAGVTSAADSRAEDDYHCPKCGRISETFLEHTCPFAVQKKT